MWRKRRNSSAPDRAVTSVINQGCVFEGRLTFVGVLIVNGRFQGEIISSGTVIVGETGVIQADLRVGTVILAGQIAGHIIASERVELRQTARILGNIATPVLVLEEGVIFDGHCKLKGNGHKVLQMIGEEPRLKLLEYQLPDHGTEFFHQVLFDLRAQINRLG